MPFGLRCALATFQRLMDIVLAGLTWRTCLVYLDDILLPRRHPNIHPWIIHRSPEAHRRGPASALREHGLRAQPAKCRFACRDLIFLGHHVSAHGIEPDPRLVEAITEYPTPTCLKQLRSFVGLAGYYRMYIAGFAGIAAPLTSLFRKGVPFAWGPGQITAFNTLRDRLGTLRAGVRQSPFGGQWNDGASSSKASSSLSCSQTTCPCNSYGNHKRT
ncbi:hypothetical protein PBRA_002623 [Plasmodiophora brassicae]|uniref:Reverse transcriptase domain-containing protein n=1 Tax=Plasmodiophora brassicae TaxID=37360 RepID=A0A0G4J5X5_PLABS|nr:hypothetical protein PBRA_002623 [Plasmodiophora brassicae]